MDEARRNRIRFRAWRRGFREADLILGGFADRELAGMSEAELARFEALLEETDHDLYAWIVGREHAPERIDAALLARLRAFRPAGEGSAG